MADASLATIWPKVYSELVEAGGIAERHYRDLTEFEFTVQNGRLFIGSARKANRSPLAHIRVTLQLLVEGVLSPEDLLARIKPIDVDALLRPEIVDRTQLTQLTSGWRVNGGAASGRIAFSTPVVSMYKSANAPAILVAQGLSPRDRAVAKAAGVLIPYSERHSHTGEICRMLRLPSVAADFNLQNLPRGKHALLVSGSAPLKEGDWLTIDGMSGEVFAGRARVETKPWTSHPELVQLSMIVERAVSSGHIPPGCAGAVWRIWDFFRHGVSLRGPDTRTGVARNRRQRISLRPLRDSNTVRQSLVQVASGAQENYNEVIRGLVSAVEKEFRSAIGPQRSGRCCRALWEPSDRELPSGSSRLIGFEFFDINRYIRSLIGISQIRFLIDCDLPSPGEAWFIEPAGRSGVRVVEGAGRIKACRIEVNGARLAHEDIPNFYTWLRRRKQFWHWFEENDTSHDEISDFLKRHGRTGATDKRMAALCFELGLLRRGSLTAVGLSLIGRRKKTPRRVQ